MDKEEDARAWKCSNYDKVMDGIRDTKIDWTIHSAGGRVKLTMQHQSDRITEFMKVLSLSHMCIPEFFTNKDGEKEKFFSGPSPDEVALVQFASTKGFDCIESNDDHILARFR